jgi:2-C-methyl-D-erythritol 4-phosphate cytidylyltransferase
MISAIIVAAGKGTRMGARQDKLFLTIAGRPLIAHTWQRFDSSQSIDEIVLVARAGAEKDMRELALTFSFQKPYKIVAGGPERQDSVWNGLEAVQEKTTLVVIQDGARPCTSEELIAATVQAAHAHGAAVAAQRVTDTIKESDGGLVIERTVDRSRLWAVQTPQTFRIEVIRRALRAVMDKGLIFTDDTAACEMIGQPVQLVESAKPNPKATSPSDLPLIELLLRQAA